MRRATADERARSPVRCRRPSAGRPSPSTPRASTRPSYTLVPPSLMPRAAANAASMIPPFGDGCCAASRRTMRDHVEPRPTRAQDGDAERRSARAGNQLATSSARALAHPKRAYRVVAVPDHRVERVDGAMGQHRRAPPIVAQNSGAVTASTVFSANDSIAALASSSAAQRQPCRGPTSDRIRWRAPARSSACSRRPTAAASSPSMRPPTETATATAVAGPRPSVRCSSQPDGRRAAGTDQQVNDAGAVRRSR